MKLYQDREWLYQKYIVEKLTTRKIAVLCRVYHVTILYWLHKFNIPIKIKKEEILEKMRIANLGKSTWNKGLTKETSEAVHRISEAKKGKNNPMYGKVPWNKNKGGYFSKEALKNIPLFKKGQIPWNKDKTFSTESKRKMRLAHLRFLKECIFEGGQIRPSYNSNACKFFAKFDQKNNTNGMYATNGGEYHIKELGYFPDYFNSKLKLIMEYDERRHYRNGKLRKRDIKRQEEIQNLFPDYKFVRIREKDLSALR